LKIKKKTNKRKICMYMLKPSVDIVHAILYNFKNFEELHFPP
jgi:hypothetical protein